MPDGKDGICGGENMSQSKAEELIAEGNRLKSLCEEQEFETQGYHCVPMKRDMCLAHDLAAELTKALEQIANCPIHGLAEVRSILNDGKKPCSRCRCSAHPKHPHRQTCVCCLIGLYEDKLKEVDENTRLRERVVELEERVELANGLAVQYGQIDGGHHKLWTIDQMVRALASDGYDALVKDAKDGEDGPDTYEWDTGIAP